MQEFCSEQSKKDIKATLEAGRRHWSSLTRRPGCSGAYGLDWVLALEKGQSDYGQSIGVVREAGPQEGCTFWGFCKEGADLSYISLQGGVPPSQCCRCRLQTAGCPS